MCGTTTPHPPPSLSKSGPVPRPPPAPWRLRNPPARVPRTPPVCPPPPYRPPPHTPRTPPARPPQGGGGRATAGPRAPPTLTPTRSTLQAGLACLVGCLCCATAYRPAPLRAKEHEHDQARTPDTTSPRASRPPATCLAAPRTPLHLCIPLRARDTARLHSPLAPKPRLRGTFRRHSLRRPPPHPRVPPSLRRRCVPVSPPPHTHCTAAPPIPPPSQELDSLDTRSKEADEKGRN